MPQEKRKALGVEITLEEREDGELYEVKTWDQGLSKKAIRIEKFQPGMRVKKVDEGHTLKGVITDRKMQKYTTLEKVGEREVSIKKKDGTKERVLRPVEKEVTKEKFSGKVRVVWDTGGTTWEKVENLTMLGVRKVFAGEDE